MIRFVSLLTSSETCDGEGRQRADVSDAGRNARTAAPDRNDDPLGLTFDQRLRSDLWQTMQTHGAQWAALIPEDWR